MPERGRATGAECSGCSLSPPFPPLSHVHSQGLEFVVWVTEGES